MNYALSSQQTQQKLAELSRRYHTLLADNDTDMRNLEAQCAQYSTAEYNRRFQAIKNWRAALRQTYERDKKQLERGA